MLKKFIKYVSQNMLGMVGMSVYILADTYFISVAVGADGITALNLVLPIYNIIFAIGAMMGVGSAIRFVVERNKKSRMRMDIFSMRVVWAFIISLVFYFVGLFLPDKLIALLAVMPKSLPPGKIIQEFLCALLPFLCGTTFVMLLCEMMEILPLRCPQLYSAVCSTSCLTIS